MTVRVKLFSAFREAVGRSELRFEFSGRTAEELWAWLVREYPALAPLGASRVVAVNREHAPHDAPLREGDEVAFFPPVSGG